MSLMSSLTDLIEDDGTWQSTIGERFYPLQAPQGVSPPWVVYRLKEEERDYAIDGPAELHMAEVHFTIESSTYLEAHAIAKLLSTILDGHRGLTGDIVVTSTRFMDSRDGEIKDEVLNLYPVICEVSVWYKHA